MYIYIITQYGNTVYKKFKFAQKNKPDKAFGDFRCQTSEYGMGSISALHGITLSAWAFAGLSGNQLANWIVQNFGQEVEIGGNMVNPVGYQMVLYVTIVLYIIALLLSVFFVKMPKESK